MDTRVDLDSAKQLADRLRQSGDTSGARTVDELIAAATEPRVPRIDYVTTTEAAGALKVTAQTIKNWVKQGRLSGFRLGSRIVIPRGAIAEYARRAGDSLDLDDVSDDEAAALVAEGRSKPPYASR